jgi:hypothetical protein
MELLGKQSWLNMNKQISGKERALEIIQASIYSDPMMDEVQVVRSVLKDMDEIEAAVLIGVSAGVPMGLYRTHFSWKISEIVKKASENFLRKLEEAYE